MSDVELVIKIPEEVKNRLCFGVTYPKDIQVVCEALNDGTPLPKGHGRILDEKDILDIENNDGGWYDLVDMPEYIAGIKAIIEADKEYEVEVITRGNCMICGKELSDGIFFCKECEEKGRKSGNED